MSRAQSRHLGRLGVPNVRLRRRDSHERHHHAQLGKLPYILRTLRAGQLVVWNTKKMPLLLSCWSLFESLSYGLISQLELMR